jgi:hypothetical protein
MEGWKAIYSSTLPSFHPSKSQPKLNKYQQAGKSGVRGDNDFSQESHERLGWCDFLAKGSQAR